jgi:hypothetical protein
MGGGGLLLLWQKWSVCSHGSALLCRHNIGIRLSDVAKAEKMNAIAPLVGAGVWRHCLLPGSHAEVDTNIREVKSRLGAWFHR